MSATLDRRALLSAERGTLYKEAETRIALMYPSPYRAAMSSLGYQQIYRVLHGIPGVAADRAMLLDGPDAARGPFVTLEQARPVGGYPMLAYSVAYELEIAGMVETLERASVPVLAADRDARHPLIVAGGPLTFSNPAPLAPLVDVVILGEGEELIAELVAIGRDVGFDRERVWAALAGRPGYYLPHVHGERVPPVAQVDDALLPARSVITTPHTELADMFMTEAARGCSRGCTYCVMRRSTNGGMRIVPREAIISGIPGDARRVGLVGAAVTDHPDIAAIVRDVVDGGREVGISSLRADKLDDELVGLLARGGYRTLTVAADGASERMRRVVERSTQARHLIRSAELAAAHRLHTLKVYMMLGVPSETDADVDELVALSKELAAIHPRVAYGLAPFVAKRNTPLDGTPFAGIDLVEARIARLRRGLSAAGLGGKVVVRPTSARWAWVEYMVAQGESSAGLAVIDAHRAEVGRTSTLPPSPAALSPRRRRSSRASTIAIPANAAPSSGVLRLAT
ncbi:MAG TPA: radical SAM protein, partial [Kofleriaceae bacterium]|nr:radical SAM protein [Kofleriaceae bacterium]